MGLSLFSLPQFSILALMIAPNETHSSPDIANSTLFRVLSLMSCWVIYLDVIRVFGKYKLLSSMP